MATLNRDSKLLGKITACGSLVLDTPMIIGSGKAGETDNDVLIDGGGKPFIPGSSWAGALRDCLSAITLKDVESGTVQAFLGDSENSQSSLVAFDLHLSGTNVNTSYRTNVRIDGKSRTAEDEGLFDYEIINAGSSFDFGFEVNVRSGIGIEKSIKITEVIFGLLCRGKIRIGAKTNSGYGCFYIDQPVLDVYDFKEKADVEAWFSGQKKNTALKLPDLSAETGNEDLFGIKAEFGLDGSLMIREASGEGKDFDYVHLKSNGRDVLSGTSLKGAIRHQAERVLNTMGKEDATDLVNDLFGYVKDGVKAQRGRLQVKETYVENIHRSSQTRIKVDPFTGGVVESALYKSEPLWGKANSNITIELEIRNPAKHEPGLMLMVFKDLWTGQLPLGGEVSIGRGMLSGKGMEVVIGQETATIHSGSDGSLEIEGRDLLDSIQNDWSDFIGGDSE